MELNGKIDNNGSSESDVAIRQAAAQPNRVTHLARLLEQRGIRLSMRWRDALPGLPVRVFNVLNEAGYETLAEVLRALRNDGAELMRQKNFGRKSLNDLLGALENAVGPEAGLYQSSFFESSEPPENFSFDDQLEIESPPPGQMLARLEASGVNLDQPWQNELPMLSTRLRNVLGRRFVTLREVVIAATDRIEDLKRAKNLGRNSLNELTEAIETLARHGPGYMRYGELGAPTASIDDLIARALQYLPDKEGRLLVRRFLDGATLEQLGHEYDLTRERIRQKILQILIKLHRRLGADACELAKSLIEATESSGGLLHSDAAVNLAAAQGIRHALLALLIAGEDSFRIWREEFLTTLEWKELERRLSAIRNCFRDNSKKALFLQDVAELVAASSGFRLDQAGLACLLTKHLDCRVAEDGSVALRGVRIPDQLEKNLRSAGRPMHISEIAGIYLAGSASSGIEAFADLESNDDEESDVGLDEERRRELAERALTAAILRHEDIYLYGPKTFVHVDALPVPLETLDEMVDLCVSRIDGETGAVTTDYLLKILEVAGLGHDGVNKFLLKDALSRRPEIIGLRKLRVGHAASLQEHGFKLVDRIEAILRASERPLSSIEIIRDAVVMYPRDIVRELANRYGEQQVLSTVTAHLHDAVRNGQARRLPVSLYFLPDVDEVALLKALTAHDRAMRNMMEAADFAQLSADDLWLFARYCYQQNDLAGADKLLSVLQTRGDLSDERRRSCNRLRSVILNGI